MRQLVFEEVDGTLERGGVDASVSDLVHPLPQVPLRVFPGLEGTSLEAAGLRVPDVALDAALVRGGVRPGGVGQASVVLAESEEILLVVSLAKVVAEDAALEVIELEPKGYASEMLEAPPDGPEERGDLLVGDELVVSAAAEAEGHDEQPGRGNLLPALELDEPEVDLGLLGWQESQRLKALGSACCTCARTS